MSEMQDWQPGPGLDPDGSWPGGGPDPQWLDPGVTADGPWLPAWPQVPAETPETLPHPVAEPAPLLPGPAPVVAPVPYEPTWSPADFDGVGTPVQDAAHWRPQQAQNSCAVVTQGAILESITGIPCDEQRLSDLAQDNGWYDPRGGTLPADVGKLLEAHGVPCEHVPHADISDIVAALERGDRVMVGLDGAEIAAPLRDPVTGLPVEQPDAGHCVWVTRGRRRPARLDPRAGQRPGAPRWAAGPGRAAGLPQCLGRPRQPPDRRPHGPGVTAEVSRMPIDHEQLRQQAADFVPRRPGGIAGLVAGVHRDPALRSWLPLESSALVPVPVRDVGGWTLWSLVGVVNREPAGTRLHQVPWGAVQWDWPGGRVVQLVDLARRPELAETLSTARAASPRAPSPAEPPVPPGTGAGRTPRPGAASRRTLRPIRTGVQRPAARVRQSRPGTSR